MRKEELVDDRGDMARKERGEKIRQDSNLFPKSTNFNVVIGRQAEDRDECQPETRDQEKREIRSEEKGK